jgi:hypothetical protein
VTQCQLSNLLRERAINSHLSGPISRSWHISPHRNYGQRRQGKNGQRADRARAMETAMIAPNIPRTVQSTLVEWWCVLGINHQRTRKRLLAITRVELSRLIPPNPWSQRISNQPMSPLLGNLDAQFVGIGLSVPTAVVSHRTHDRLSTASTLGVFAARTSE